MDWTFDTRSALLVGALLTTVVGGLLLLVARGFAPSYRASMGWWVAGTLMLPASFVVLAAREQLRIDEHHRDQQQHVQGQHGEAQAHGLGVVDRLHVSPRPGGLKTAERRS